MSEGTMGDRIQLVLDFDGVSAKGRAAYLARLSGFSVSTARRILNGAPVRNMSFERLWKLAECLSVDVGWLWDGDIFSIHPRTMRIDMQKVKGISEPEAEGVARLMSGYLMNHRLARNLIGLAKKGDMGLVAAGTMYLSTMRAK